MNIALLFLVAVVIVAYFIARHEKQNVKKIEEDIHRANKNVPPLFMLRSAELKVNAIRSALKNSALTDPFDQDVIKTNKELDKLIDGYQNRDITLAAYYTKLGSLLIKVTELKGVPAGIEVS